MNVLELFKGTGSVGKVCEGLGHNVVSVDINKKFNPTHLCDIMDFDYKQYPQNYFQIVWASPPCTEYSKAKTRGIRNIDDANKTVLKTLEIINYFDCDYWYIENPQTSLLKKQTFMETLPYIDCDYCMYGKPYRKRTRIWTNKKIQLKLCNKKCGSFINGRHIGSCGNGRSKYTNKPYTLEEKYSIPPDLIFSLLFNI
jgi:site-specific DNA-cytosine methylase